MSENQAFDWTSVINAWLDEKAYIGRYSWAQVSPCSNCGSGQCSDNLCRNCTLLCWNYGKHARAPVTYIQLAMHAKL